MWFIIDSTQPSPRYTAAVIVKSTYDYDLVSRKDELIDIVSKVLHIVVAVVGPHTAFLLGAFPWCESTTFPISRVTMI